MSNLRIAVERRVVVSSRKFDDVLASIHAAIGHPDMHTFWKEIAATSTYAEMEAVVRGAIGPSDPRSKQPTRLVRKLSDLPAMLH